MGNLLAVPIAERDVIGKQIFRVNIKETSTMCCREPRKQLLDFGKVYRTFTVIVKWVLPLKIFREVGNQ
jgi:hypothetical protein